VHGATRDIENVSYSSTAWKKGTSCRRQRIVQNATRLTTTTAHLREFTSTIEDLPPGITVNSLINGSQSMIGWGARPTFMIDWEVKSMKSQAIVWERWPNLWSLMKTSCVDLSNVDVLYNWMMNGQPKHVRGPFYNIVQMA
jgi:hypothetical protein